MRQINIGGSIGILFACIAIGGCASDQEPFAGKAAPEFRGPNEQPGPDYVAAPGTWIHKSCVYEVPHMARIEHAENDELIVWTEEGEQYARIPRCPHASFTTRPLQVFESEDADAVTEKTLNNWVEWTYQKANNPFGFDWWNKVTIEWTVPGNPPMNGGVVHLFTGLQKDGIAAIVQPVLSWGRQTGIDPPIGGNYWYIATYYVPPNTNNLIHSPPKTVYTGDSIKGSLDAVNCTSSGDCYYVIVAERISGTYLTTALIADPAEYPMDVLVPAALEARKVDYCDQLPSTWTVFHDGYAYQPGYQGNGYYEPAPAWSINYFYPPPAPICDWEVVTFARGATLKN